LKLDDLLEFAKGQLLALILPHRFEAAKALKVLDRLKDSRADGAWLAASLLYRGDDRRRLVRLQRIAATARVPLLATNEVLYQYPDEPVPRGKTAQQHLEDLTWAGVKQYFAGKIDETLRATLRKELDLIAELKYAHYFLTVHDIVRYARSQSILCQGRGSAANSAVCYVLGITSVDPTKVDLLFERFISKERLEPPDIDVDFEHSRR